MLRRVLIMALCFSAIRSVGSGQTGDKRGAGARRTIDRVVASVDGTAITESDVETEYRTEVFLEEGRVAPRVANPETFAHVLERVIDQKLLAEEAAAEHQDSGASQEKAEQTLASLRRRFATEEAFRAPLRSLGLNEHDLLAKIEQQQRILQNVDQRIRPLVSVEPDEIDAYYQKTFLPEWAKKSKEGAPALAAVEDPIQEILVQKKIDQQLDVWLKELRTAHRVRLTGNTSHE
jgi:peptidyl-prolyl cis-trans isomerase SurA